MIFLGRRHGVDVLMRPEDVIGPDCGDEVKLTCMAKVKDISKVSFKDKDEAF